MPNWGQILTEIKQLQQPRNPQPHDTLRRQYLKELSEITGRDVILYSSGWTHLNNHSPDFSISDSDLHGLMEVVYGLDGPDVDLILHSPGGTPTSAESLVDYLHSKFNNVRIFVPHAAMSAGTMMCCAAHELVMGRHSFLGPIDPQITLDTPTGVRPVPAQAILEQFNQAKEEIEEDENNLAQWTPILRQYGPGLLVECEQAINLSQELAEKWAKKYIFARERNAESKAIDLAETLSDFERFKSHGRHINREKAREFGFNVTDLEDNQELQDAVLSAYHATTITHVQTGVAKIIENHNENAFIQGGSEHEPEHGQPMGQHLPMLERPPEGPAQTPLDEE